MEQLTNYTQISIPSEEDALQCGRNSGGKSRGGRAGSRMARVQSGFNQLGTGNTGLPGQRLRTDSAYINASRALRRSSLGRSASRTGETVVANRPARAGRGMTTETVQVGS